MLSAAAAAVDSNARRECADLMIFRARDARAGPPGQQTKGRKEGNTAKTFGGLVGAVAAQTAASEPAGGSVASSS